MSELWRKIPSESFLEYAFLRWVLAPACKTGVQSVIVPQHPCATEEHTYLIDYVLVGEKLRIAVELDGFAFHSSREAFSYDRLRQNDLLAAGYTVLRFTYDSVRSDTRRCVEQLQALMVRDPLLATLTQPDPVVEAPDMEPNPLLALGPSPIPVAPSHTYFDTARGRLNLNTLRLCQREAFMALGNYYANGGKRAACVMSVGAGKTALGVAAALAFTQQRALVITPSNVIRGTFARALNQNDTRNVLYHLPDGPLIPSCPPPEVAALDGQQGAVSELKREQLLRADIIVTNFHALGTGTSDGDLLSKLSPADIDMVVVDEAHIAASDSYQRTFAYFSGARTLLMSACFERLDGKPIEADVVYRYRLTESVADGHAKHLRVSRFEPDPEASVYELRHTDGTVEEIRGREAVLEVLNDERKLARLTVKSVEPIRRVLAVVKQALIQQTESLHPVKPRVLFSALGQRHAEQIADLARQAGIPTDHLHHSMSDARVRNVKKRFEDDGANLQGVVQLKMLGQGYDLPAISVVAPFRPYGSFSEFYQFVGRGVRTIRHPALKGQAQFVDVVLHAELGLDAHLNKLLAENVMDPSGGEDAKEAAITVTTVEVGDEKQESPSVNVIHEEGETRQEILHAQQPTVGQLPSREKAALAQRYAVYAQKSDNPLSFEEYLAIFRKPTGG